MKSSTKIEKSKYFSWDGPKLKALTYKTLFFPLKNANMTIVMFLIFTGQIISSRKIF